jgi:hypothetical protein
MDFIYKQQKPNYFKWGFVIIFLSVCFYEIFAPVSYISQETPNTPHDERVFRQIRAVGCIILLSVLYYFFVFGKISRLRF